jgi:hypothetical protein
LPTPTPDADAPESLTDLAGLLAGTPKVDNEGGDPPEGDEQQPADPRGGDGDGNPPQGETDAVDSPEEGDEPEPDGEGSEPSTEPFYTVKIDGKDERVTLKEALAGYQRNADYTRKTQEVAEARKAIEAETAQARQQREQYAQVLKLVQERLGPADQEPTAEQWNALRQADPTRYATEWTDYQRREAQRNAVKLEQERVANDGRAESLNKARQFVEGERQKLVAALPILADKDKGPAELKAIREYAAKTFNYSEAEMDQAYDHRMIIAIDKARQWDNHLAALAKAKAKVSSAPQLPAPGARKPQTSSKAAARKAAQEKFNKSGRVEDAVSLLIGA